LNEFKSAAFLSVGTLLLVLHLALLFELILLDRHVELSENVRVAEYETFEYLGLSVRILDADLRSNCLSLEGEEALRVASDVRDGGLLRLACLGILLFLDEGSSLFWRLAEAQLLVVEVAGRRLDLEAKL